MTVRTNIYTLLNGNLSVDVYNARSLPFLSDHIPCITVHNPTNEATLTEDKDETLSFDTSHTIEIVAIVQESTNWADEAESIIQEVKDALFSGSPGIFGICDWAGDYSEEFSLGKEGELLLGFGVLTFSLSNKYDY